jgi:predicted nucleic acid-binding Zn ribbon protein
MKPTNDKTLKEAMQQMLKAYRLKGKFDETSVIKHWEDVVGKSVSNRTKEIYIRDKKLFVRIESAVIKNQLLMMRTQIMANLNEKVGALVIQEMVFL